MKTDAPDRPGGARGCAAAAQVAAYLAAEMTGDERLAFERHLSACDACRREVAATRRVLERLQALPSAMVARDLAPAVLARIDAEAAAPRVVWSWPAWARIAAAAALAVGIVAACRLWAGRGAAEGALAAPAPAVQAANWLCRTQEPDGSWSTARWGGSRRYEVALTALSLLSLLDESASGVPGRGRAADLAVNYLCGRQDDQGGFGEAFDGAPYNQGLAALALLRAYRAQPDGKLKLVLDRAIAGIMARQLRDGGWGYLGMETPASNLSITLWQVEALRLAVALGWEAPRTPTARGLRWIATVAADDGSFGYRQSGDFPEGSRTLTAMGAMSLLDVAEGNLLPADRRAAIKARVRRLAAANPTDWDYYGRYFLSAALKGMGEDTARRQLAAMRTALASAQVRRGPECGSWNADDRWGSAGGRVYATAMASLSLQ